ncbi:unnamed protein product [Bursaphelenchus okinawaensis]|uniref:RNA polymerase II-associated factor 1 homolog n=1 Tax=Bursaphelenchus okinawaensis TaxID=465554 RepID=A0A811LWT0_9BILA|nr:unnamed protein product [Bursaphelenchus okinawaensis]CAG9128512.1 unnamed protein product [Bursaphelenchus okinawaensis]
MKQTIIKIESKFAGESFGTDNIRTVYAGEARDTERRPDRTIILVGPIGAGKSSFIDFLCNHFYDAKFDSNFRYKIADEIFDSTTPKKAVTKYVFNATKLSYRPIIIDTPGIGDPLGLKADRELAKLVTDYLSAASKDKIHAVGLILPSYMHTINQQIDDDIHLTLSLFPAWMKQNVVPIITYSDFKEYDPNLLKHFGLEDNSRFYVNNEYLFKAKPANSILAEKERVVWNRNERSIIEFLRYIGSLRPQTIERRLPSESEANPNQDYEERRVRASRETITYFLETDEVKQIREEFTEKSGSQGFDTSHKAATSTVFTIPVNKPSTIGSRVENRGILSENRFNIGQEMGRQDNYVEKIEETVENLELLRRYIYDPVTRTYRIEYAHEVKVHESRRSSQGGSLHNSFSDLRRLSPSKGDITRNEGDYSRPIKRNSSAPNLEKDGKENLNYSPEVLRKLLGDAIMYGSATRPEQTDISPVRSQVVRKPYDPSEFEHQSRAQPRNIPIGLGAGLEPAPVSQTSPDHPDRSVDKNRDGIFERNSSSRQSLHNSPIRHGGVRHAIVNRDPEGSTHDLSQPASNSNRPAIQPLPRHNIGQGQSLSAPTTTYPVQPQNTLPYQPNTVSRVDETNQTDVDPRYSVPQRSVVITQQRREQGPGYWIGQGGREIEDTTITRRFPQAGTDGRGYGGGPGGKFDGQGGTGNVPVGQGGAGNVPLGQGGTGNLPIGQGGNVNGTQNGAGGVPIGQGAHSRSSSNQNNQNTRPSAYPRNQNQPYPYDLTGRTAGYPLQPGQPQGNIQPGQGQDPRYQQGLEKNPQQSYDPNRGPYVQTDVHGVRTDYVGRRDGRWIEKRGYEITREDLGTPKDVDPSLNDQQRLLNPEAGRPRRRAKKRSPLYNCCFYIVAPLVVLAVVSTVVITLILLA